MKQVINYLRYKKAPQKYVYIRGVYFIEMSIILKNPS